VLVISTKNTYSEYDWAVLVISILGTILITSAFIISSTGGPRYMGEIGTPNIDSHITNSNIKRPTMTVN